MTDRPETGAVRRETDAWHDLYADPAEIARRRRNMPRKLERLGVTRAPRDSHVLDMCCGHGEALRTLLDLGFTNLHGFDQRIHAAPRTETRIVWREGDARATGYPPESFDWILNIHAMHHLGSVEALSLWFDEMHRILKPSGRLSLVDFRVTPQLHLAFWLVRRKWLQRTRYLRHFGRQIVEEWDILRYYIDHWNEITSLLRNRNFRIVGRRTDLWHHYLVLEKRS